MEVGNTMEASRGAERPVWSGALAVSTLPPLGKQAAEVSGQVDLPGAFDCGTAPLGSEQPRSARRLAMPSLHTLSRSFDSVLQQQGERSLQEPALRENKSPPDLLGSYARPPVLGEGSYPPAVSSPAAFISETQGS